MKRRNDREPGPCIGTPRFIRDGHPFPQDLLTGRRGLLDAAGNDILRIPCFVVAHMDAIVAGPRGQRETIRHNLPFVLHIGTAAEIPGGGRWTISNDLPFGCQEALPPAVQKPLPGLRAGSEEERGRGGKKTFPLDVGRGVDRMGGHGHRRTLDDLHIPVDFLARCSQRHEGNER